MQSVETGKGIDWGNAESLAMGSLLLEGHWVRLMGQDVERGTFSHRHAILYDFNNNNRYVPLAHLSKDQGHITITNSTIANNIGPDYAPSAIFIGQFGGGFVPTLTLINTIIERTPIAGKAN